MISQNQLRWQACPKPQFLQLYTADRINISAHPVGQQSQIFLPGTPHLHHSLGQPMQPLSVLAQAYKKPAAEAAGIFRSTHCG